MTVAAFILGIIGTLTGVGALGWNVVEFFLAGARPKLRPLVCVVEGSKMLLAMPANVNVRQHIEDGAARLRGKVVVGVEVVNAGRSPLHVIGWAWRSDPAGVVPVAFEPQGPQPPCEIAPGASQTFVAEGGAVVRAVRASREMGIEPKAVYAYVASGGRTYNSKPLAAEIVKMLEAAEPPAPAPPPDSAQKR